MTAPLSIVIPTLNAADRLGPCLGALAPGLMEGLIAELIFADGGSTDGIAEVADGIGAVLVPAPPGRGVQLAAGCRAARAPWILILHADTILSEGWEAAVRAHFESAGAQAGYFDLGFDAGGFGARWTAGWANLRARLFGLPYGDQGLLIPRTLYDRAGGYPEIPLMEDVALVRRIGRRRMRPLGMRVTTSAERYLAEGWLRRGARNVTTLALWFLGVAPERLAARYRGARPRASDGDAR